MAAQAVAAARPLERRLIMQIKTTLNLAVAVGFAVTLALGVPPRVSAGQPSGCATCLPATPPAYDFSVMPALRSRRLHGV